MEEMPNPTSQEATRSVLGPVIWQEVLRTVIAPRIAKIVADKGDEIENRQQLHRAFCDEHGIKPSYSTFSGWCEDLGISFRKRIEVRIPGWREMPRQSTDFIGPMPAAPTSKTMRISPVEDEPVDPDAPVQWDNKPTAREINPEHFNDNMPTILPGGLRAPTFIGESDFAN
jgi:hypothetical protein